MNCICYIYLSSSTIFLRLSINFRGIYGRLCILKVTVMQYQAVLYIISCRYSSFNTNCLRAVYVYIQDNPAAHSVIKDIYLHRRYTGTNYINELICIKKSSGGAWTENFPSLPTSSALASGKAFSDVGFSKYRMYSNARYLGSNPDPLWDKE